MSLKLILARMAVALLLVSEAAGALPAENSAPLRISNRFSPYNRKRPRRPYTRYIVLHTTEGEEKGSLNEVIRYGETHYFVTKSGQVYRIIDKSKIAKHAGRSMWEGHATIDNYSIGIEVSGYYNRDLTDAQYGALRELLRQLKSLYGISDKEVVTHSMVAYGRPNHFHKENHRGRKRCGMIFAKPEVRARLGLKAAPDHDADVDAGRLVVADRELFSFLFPGKPGASSVGAGVVPAYREEAPVKLTAESSVIDGSRTAWEIAGENYSLPSTVYVFPNGNRVTGDQIEDWSQIPANTRVIMDEADTQSFEGFLEVGRDGDTATEVAGNASTSDTTIYFFPDGLIRTGEELNRRRSTQKLLDHPPKKTKVLIGYVYGGYVKSKRPASGIAGVKWNYPSTFYRYPDGSIYNGDTINDREIPGGTLVFYQQ